MDLKILLLAYVLGWGYARDLPSLYIPGYLPYSSAAGLFSVQNYWPGDLSIIFFIYIWSWAFFFFLAGICVVAR